MAEEQAQNGAPEAPQAPTGDAAGGAANDTTPAPDAPTPQTPPSEPLPSTNTDQGAQTPSGASEPAQPVSGTAQPANSTAQTTNNEPLDIPPFDNSPTPLPQSPIPAPSPAGAGQSGRDLLAKARQTIQQKKSKKLEKILEMFSTKPSITNDEVEKLLHVSDATATRYLSELEKQGKIRQEGKTGHAVSYSRM